MRGARFEWDEDNVEHIARHGVDPSEAEEVLRGRRVEQGARGGLRMAWGASAVGRHLLVVFANRKGVIRVVTARDMSAREKMRFRRRKRR